MNLSYEGCSIGICVVTDIFIYNFRVVNFALFVSSAINCFGIKSRLSHNINPEIICCILVVEEKNFTKHLFYFKRLTTKADLRRSNYIQTVGSVEWLKNWQVVMDLLPKVSTWKCPSFYRNLKRNEILIHLHTFITKNKDFQKFNWRRVTKKFYCIRINDVRSMIHLF